MRIVVVSLLVILTVNSVDAQTADARIQQLVTSAPFKEATAFLERDYDRFLEE
jgi:hypothetical protein